MTITGIAHVAGSCLSASMSSRPDLRGSSSSVTTTSGWCLRARRTASGPVCKHYGMAGSDEHFGQGRLLARIGLSEQDDADLVSRRRRRLGGSIEVRAAGGRWTSWSVWCADHAFLLRGGTRHGIEGQSLEG